MVSLSSEKVNSLWIISIPFIHCKKFQFVQKLNLYKTLVFGTPIKGVAFFKAFSWWHPILYIFSRFKDVRGEKGLYGIFCSEEYFLLKSIFVENTDSLRGGTSKIYQKKMTKRYWILDNHDFNYLKIFFPWL